MQVSGKFRVPKGAPLSSKEPDWCRLFLVVSVVIAKCLCQVASTRSAEQLCLRYLLLLLLAPPTHKTPILLPPENSSNPLTPSHKDSIRKFALCKFCASIARVREALAAGFAEIATTEEKHVKRSGLFFNSLQTKEVTMSAFCTTAIMLFAGIKLSILLGCVVVELRGLRDLQRR